MSSPILSRSGWGVGHRWRAANCKNPVSALVRPTGSPALPGNRTRLEGNTWYQMRIAPASYWAIVGDGIIHAIHERVLEHIQRNAESR